jgi:hypothetical protein
MPVKRYHSGRGWTDRQLDAGLDRLRAAGILDGHPPALTDEGTTLREGIEVATDRQQRPILQVIGADFERLVTTIEPWAAAIVADGGFPSAITELSPDWGRVDDDA